MNLSVYYSNICRV